MRWLEYTLFLAVVVGLARPVGLYVARVFEARPTPLDRWLRPLERSLYRLMGVRPEDEMTAGSIWLLPRVQRARLGLPLLSCSCSSDRCPAARTNAT